MVYGLNMIQMMRDQALEARGNRRAVLQLIIDSVGELTALSFGYICLANPT